MNSTLSLYRDIWRAGKQDAAAIAIRQQERLQSIVDFARRRSRFYREKYADLPASLTDVGQLPPVTKPEMMARFDKVMTDPLVTRAAVDTFLDDKSRIGHPFLERYTVCTTSGTTGAPAVFVLDEQMMAVVGALGVLRTMPAWLSGRQLLQLMGSGMRSASIWADHGHFLGVAMARRQILERPSREKRLRIFSVLTPLPKLVKQLNEYQPVMINGYASAVALLAEEQAAGRLNIHPLLITTSSESLSQEARERIASVFNCVVRDNYGASEFVALGFDCGHGWLHINADWAIVEAVDEENRPAPVGETSSKMLLTNLANRVQPIIRYEMGDRITFNPEPCACGRTLPALRVEGRSDDVLRFTDLSGKSVAVLPLALWSVMKETPGIGRFQAIQTGDSEMTLRLEANGREGNVWPTLHRRVKVFLDDQGLSTVNIIRAKEPPQRDPKSGKFRQVWVRKRGPE